MTSDEQPGERDHHLAGTTGLAARDVWVQFGAVAAVAGVSLDVPAGMVLAVTGPAGAGKSTLLATLAGAQRPDQGQVWCAGRPIRARTQAAGWGVALVPQGGSLVDELTAAENILMVLSGQQIRGPQATQRTVEALLAVGLEQVSDHLAEELSGGQQQRAALARVLALRPQVLLADEPTSELDEANRDRVLRLLLGAAGQGVAVVVATHDAELAKRCDGELALHQGAGTWVRPLPEAMTAGRPSGVDGSGGTSGATAPGRIR